MKIYKKSFNKNKVYNNRFSKRIMPRSHNGIAMALKAMPFGASRFDSGSGRFGKGIEPSITSTCKS